VSILQGGEDQLQRDFGGPGKNQREIPHIRAGRPARKGVPGKKRGCPVRRNDGDGKASDLIRIGERKHYKGWAARECGSGGKGAGFDAGVRA